MGAIPTGGYSDSARRRPYADFEPGDELVPSHEYSDEVWVLDAKSSNAMVTLRRKSDDHIARCQIEALNAYEHVD